MDWLVTNWYWMLLFVAFIAMHLFGHGGHGVHRSDGGADHQRRGGEWATDEVQKRRDNASGHQH